jgi:hypothetical protein
MIGFLTLSASTCLAADMEDVGFTGESRFIQVKIAWGDQDSSDLFSFFLRDTDKDASSLPFVSRPIRRGTLEETIRTECELDSKMRDEMREMLRGSFMSSLKMPQYISSLLCILTQLSPGDEPLFQSIRAKLGLSPPPRTP